MTANITFDSVTSGGGLSNIELTRVNGTVTMNGGALSGATSQAVDIDTGTASITYAGTLNSTRGIFVANKTGGTVTFSGADQDAEHGRRRRGEPYEQRRHHDQLHERRPGHRPTTSGAGFSATGGGTVTVTGSGNTLATTSGTALNVTNTTIGGSGLTFQSISSNGATNGIVLNTTGAGFLTVTGTGTIDGSGGTIQNADQGALFTSASNITLKNMNFTNANTGNGTCNNIDGPTFNNSCKGAINLSSVTTVDVRQPEYRPAACSRASTARPCPA